MNYELLSSPHSSDFGNLYPGENLGVRFPLPDLRLKHLKDSRKPLILNKLLLSKILTGPSISE
jgi:hypothetical protein